MRTQQNARLSKPTGDECIPDFTLGYFRARNKKNVHDTLCQEFEKSTLSQIQLAHRLGREKADVVCRVLGAPSNLTVESLSDYIFAMGGGEIVLSVRYPLDKQQQRAEQQSAPQTARERIDMAAPFEVLPTLPTPEAQIIKLFDVTSGTTASPASAMSVTSTAVHWEQPLRTGT